MSLMLMLQALRTTPRLEQACRSGQWYLDASSTECLGEIGGKTVGLVDFGDIPQLLALNNVVVAPHVSWLTNETWARSMDVAVENCLALANNTPLRFRVV